MLYLIIRGWFSLYFFLIVFLVVLFKLVVRFVLLGIELIKKKVIVIIIKVIRKNFKMIVNVFNIFVI